MTQGFPPVFPPGSAMSNPFGFSLPPPGAGITVPPPAAGGIIPIIPPAAAGLPVSTAPLVVPKPSPGKGLNALLGLPTPSGEPAPPGTLVLPDGSHIQKKKRENKDDRAIGSDEENKDDEKEIDFEDMKVVDEYVAENDVSIQDIPMPDADDADAAAKAVNEQIQEAFNEELAKAAQGGNELEITEDSKRPYKFAWDEDIQEVELDESDNSDVSSVHTSDLSNFDESNESGDDDIETLEIKLLQLKKEEMGKYKLQLFFFFKPSTTVLL